MASLPNNVVPFQPKLKQAREQGRRTSPEPLLLRQDGSVVNVFDAMEEIAAFWAPFLAEARANQENQ